MTIEELLEGKVKLEFGNVEQIKAIDDYQAKQSPGKFRVTIDISCDCEMEIEADNEDDAREKAEEEFDLNMSDLDISYSVKRIEPE